MNRRQRNWSRLAAAGLGVVLAAGCDYSMPDTGSNAPGRYTPGALPTPELGKNKAAKSVTSPRSPEERKAILDSSITLIERAAIQPGGGHFDQAVRKLNQYFDEGTDPSKYELDPPAREYLVAQLGPESIRYFQSRDWTLRDTRHIEDCMMYYKIANRIAGTGDDLARVRRLFDWVVRQVELVPAGSFGGSPRGPAFARPYDVLLRGMATELEGTTWAERAWLFMALCRQLDIDSGLVTFTRTNTLDAVLPNQAGQTPTRRPQRPPIVWLCTAIVGDQAYLFDTRLGLEIPGPGGQGVATLAQAISDPSILEQMNLPGLAPYPAGRATLLASPTKIGILIDSSRGYFSPKMRLLQRELAGKDRTILFRDPAEQRDHFVRVLGAHAGPVSLWEIPLQIEARLFPGQPTSDPDYVRAIQTSLFWFQPEFPLIYARVKQLRGELAEAIDDYGKFRFAENLPLVIQQKGAPRSASGRSRRKCRTA